MWYIFIYSVFLVFFIFLTTQKLYTQFNNMVIMHALVFWNIQRYPIKENCWVLLSCLHSHCSRLNWIFNLVSTCEQIILTAVWFLSLSFDTSGPTDHQPAGLSREEDDLNPHPNPNTLCPSAKLCTPTTPRTQTSSASMLRTLSTSSKRVSSIYKLIISHLPWCRQPGGEH